VNTSLANQSLKPEPQPNLEDFLLSRHANLVAEVKNERWMNAERTDDDRLDMIGIFSRTFEARLYLTPGIQWGFTEVSIAPRVDELVVPKSNLKLLTHLLIDLRSYERQTGSRVTDEQLMNAMGVESIPRLCDLELQKLGAERLIATSTVRPEMLRGGPEPRCIGYVVQQLEITLSKNPLDREIRAGDLSIEEFRHLNGPQVYGSPDQLS
jgi:hypothetical protein